MGQPPTTAFSSIDCRGPQTSVSEGLRSVRHQLQAQVKQDQLKLTEALKLNSAKLKTLHILKTEKIALQKHIELQRQQRTLAVHEMSRTKKEGLERELRDLQLTANLQDVTVHSLKRHTHALKCKIPRKHKT